VRPPRGWIRRPLEVNEFPGFVTSWINCLYRQRGDEQTSVKGMVSAQGKALKLGLGYTIGPLELADLVGLDTSHFRNLEEYLHRILREKYRLSSLLRREACRC
jgi:3-hydroxybutyryl-CoA dehydrogenase